MIYEIRIGGHLDPAWSDWLGGLAIRHDADGGTTLRGHIPDQAALHGVLSQLQDLGLSLISVAPASDAGDAGGDRRPE